MSFARSTHRDDPSIACDRWKRRPPPTGSTMGTCGGGPRDRLRHRLLRRLHRARRWHSAAHPTSILFRRGHNIRLDISSSNFPRFDVNPNTGEPLHSLVFVLRAPYGIEAETSWFNSGDPYKRVHFSGKHRPVTDGPFTETKELVAGFWLWEVHSIEEAVEWVKRCPNPMLTDSDIEIRPVFEAEDFGENLTPEVKAQEQQLRSRPPTRK